MVVLEAGCLVQQKKAIVEGHKEVARRRASCTQSSLTPGCQHQLQTSATVAIVAAYTKTA